MNLSVIHCDSVDLNAGNMLNYKILAPRDSLAVGQNVILFGQQCTVSQVQHVEHEFCFPAYKPPTTPFPANELDRIKVQVELSRGLVKAIVMENFKKQLDKFLHSGV